MYVSSNLGLKGIKNMKAHYNLSKTVINNWRIGELNNIKRCKNFTPKVKGYFWYKCPKCGLKATFDVPVDLNNPDQQIGNEIIKSKKVPKKIYCPKCMLGYESKISFMHSRDAINDIYKNVPFMEQEGEMIKFDVSLEKEGRYPTEKDNFFLAVFEEKIGVPIYRGFEEMLRNG